MTAKRKAAAGLRPDGGTKTETESSRRDVILPNGRLVGRMYPLEPTTDEAELRARAVGRVAWDRFYDRLLSGEMGRDGERA